MAKTPKAPKVSKGKLDPDSVQELSEEEMAKVQGGIKMTEKSVLTTSYFQRSPSGETVISVGGGPSLGSMDIYFNRLPTGKPTTKGS